MAPTLAEIGMLPTASSYRPSTSGLLLTNVILRALTAVLMFISLIILTTNRATVRGKTYLKFNDVISYRYLLFTILLGFLYSILQTALTLFQLKSGNRVSNILVYVDFYGDLVLLYALATGAAAGFGATMDVQRTFENLTGGESSFLDTFFEKGNATASMVFLGSVCSAVSVVLSVFGLDR